MKRPAEWRPLNEPRGRPHPSRRPVKRDDYRRAGYARVPYSEPLTARLRSYNGAEAIGFTAHIGGYDGEDE